MEYGEIVKLRSWKLEIASHWLDEADEVVLAPGDKLTVYWPFHMELIK